LKCDLCPFTCYGKLMMTNHVIGTHNGRSLKYPCDMCPFVTTSKQEMIEHLHVHDSKFNILKEEGLIREKLWCPVLGCPRIARADKLFDHMRKAHGINTDIIKHAIQKIGK